MSEELKACPFCGKTPRKHITEDGYYWILCDECGCHAAKRSPEAAERYWNSRPVENPLRQRIAELEAALRKIANGEESCGTIDCEYYGCQAEKIAKEALEATK